MAPALHCPTTCIYETRRYAQRFFGAKYFNRTTLRDASAVLFWPYSFHSSKTNEIYALSIPLIMPAAKLWTWNSGHFEMPSFPSPVPGKTWRELTDPYVWPHVITFSSWGELPKLLMNLSDDVLADTSRKMKLFWDAIN